MKYWYLKPGTRLSIPASYINEIRVLRNSRYCYMNGGNVIYISISTATSLCILVHRMPYPIITDR
jgi:hypothetical protein